MGKVALGSGESATLDFSGDGFLQVAVPTKSGSTAALIQNSGSIKANGGHVIIAAATARFDGSGFSPPWTQRCFLVAG
jgi:hypothetical protein